MKLVVMSDLHLVGAGETSMTLDTAARLEVAVAAVNARHADADAVILAGDLADLGQREAYERLAEITGRLVVPLVITLGNHDDRPTFQSVFGPGNPETGKIDHVLDIKGYRVIVLDSSEPGRVDGVLTEVQLDWLRRQLETEKPVVVILHHNANALHIEADTIKLLDEAPFIAALKTHDDIRQVIAGHVHLTSTALHHGIPFTTLAGGHYSVTFNIDQPRAPFHSLTGPGQMALVLGTPTTTTVLFEDFIDGNAVIGIHHPE